MLQEQGLGPAEAESFDKQQWGFLSPVFPHITPDNKHALRLELDSRIILPFTYMGD